MTGSTEFQEYDRKYRILKAILCPVARRLVRFQADPVQKIEGPAFILSNHNTDLDFLLIASVFPFPLDFVATESLRRMGRIGKFVSESLRPILHDKGSVGIGTVRQITERIKAGRSILLFPEGNRSFDGRTCPIPAVTGKLARIAGATLVLYKLEGGYLTSPRWGRGFRRGKMRGRIAGVYTADELRNMEPQQVQRIIEEALWTDANEEQKRNPVAFRSARGAEYLETVMFRCPACGQYGSLHSWRSSISCSCGLTMRYTPYGTLVTPDGNERTVTALLEEQNKTFAAELNAGINKNSVIWTDKLHCLRIGSGHQVIGEEDIQLSVTYTHLILGDTYIPAEEVQDITIVQRNRLGIHLKNRTEHFELLGTNRFNAYKYRVWVHTL